MQKIVGHSVQRAELKKLLSVARLPSAMIFTGQAGIGKYLVARELSRSLYCQVSNEKNSYGGCGECQSCVLFEAGNMPDFHLLECGQREVSSVDAMRELLYTLSLKSFSGLPRIVIFRDAEEISAQSANVLLKNIEEPRPDTHYILITSSPTRLPATLLSRCQRWFFDSLAAHELLEILESGVSRPGGVAVADLIALADGSMESVTYLTEREAQWSELGRKLKSVANGDAVLALELAEAIGKDKENLPASFQLLRLLARKSMHEGQTVKEKQSWALALTNIIAAEQLIFERNLSAVYVLRVVLTLLAEGKSDSAFALSAESDKLLEEMVV